MRWQADTHWCHGYAFHNVCDEVFSGSNMAVFLIVGNLFWKSLRQEPVQFGFALDIVRSLVRMLESQRSFDGQEITYSPAIRQKLLFGGILPASNFLPVWYSVKLRTSEVNRDGSGLLFGCLLRFSATCFPSNGSLAFCRLQKALFRLAKSPVVIDSAHCTVLHANGEIVLDG